MNQSKVRAYLLTSGATYLTKHASKSNSGRHGVERLSSEVRACIETAKGSAMIPASYCAELYREIAALADNNEDKAREMLIECGKETALEASNTFLRLVMKVLTPTLFAKKLPAIWSRDCTRGTVLAEVHDDRIRNRFVDIGGFDHIAPVAIGYVTFALEAMGKSVTNAVLHDWSLATPAPDTFSFDVTWKK